jgi:hypothetical protein
MSEKAKPSYYLNIIIDPQGDAQEKKRWVRIGALWATREPHIHSGSLNEGVAMAAFGNPYVQIAIVEPDEHNSGGQSRGSRR